MSNKKVKKRKVERIKQSPVIEQPAPAMEIQTEEQVRRERYCEIGFVVLLFAFGVYQSVLYFGHTVVPISDFPDLYDVGRKILSFRLPVRFMQAPGLGMLQVILSPLVGGVHPTVPNLTAGWLLNALLHPFSLVLMYLVAREIIGKSAVWFALIAMINPWVVYMLTQPIVETTYTFFILLTLLLMFRRSKWCYLAAAMTTMVRYEATALIGAAWLLDMIEAKNRRQRVNAFVYSALACIPLALWMLGTYFTWSDQTGHYFNVWKKDYSKRFNQPVSERTGIGLHLKLLWYVAFRPLLTTVTEIKTTFRMIRPTAETAEAVKSLYTAGKIIFALGAGFGTIYGLVKRNWKIVALLIFFVPYFLLHASYPYPLQRFHTTIFWMALLLFFFGMQSMWKLINGGGRVPRAIVSILQVVVGLIAVIWLVGLFSYVGKVSKASPTSASLPYVALALLVVIFAVRVFLYRIPAIPREFAILACIGLFVVSNQFKVVALVNDGQREAEFKRLGEWYVKNAKPDDKMGLYMASITRMFALEQADKIVSLPNADTPQEFVEACYEKGLTYVVWATREGYGNHALYKSRKLDVNIGFLKDRKDQGPYKYVGQVGAGRGYVNIFRLEKRDGPDG